MTDKNEETSPAVEEQPKPSTMAETEQQQHEKMNASFSKMNTSFSIWPPTQRTRDAVINRLIETLFAPSVLSKRYGTIPHDEASTAARRIEDEAFSTASASATADDDGVEILQVYSKEISKRMLELVKSRSASGSAADGDTASQSSDVAPTITASEENSTVETES
ncbi:MFP1 attachment factor 1-like [Cornus florida]|uniref:MFP1 attachment factor 1-like n=1 Tax=Cornus florida TaxID=4283 RepID=UPI002898C56A|nr:MFP1 attachment factor 1-like [Cornus florida]